LIYLLHHHSYHASIVRYLLAFAQQLLQTFSYPIVLKQHSIWRARSCAGWKSTRAIRYTLYTYYVGRRQK